MNRVELSPRIHLPLDSPHSQHKSSYHNLRNCIVALLTSLLPMVALMMPGEAQAIVDGKPSAQPWVVQGFGLRADISTSTCTGVAINDLMVITAKHCKIDMVYFSNDARLRDIQVASHHDIPGADLQVLVLEENHLLAEYPELSTKALPTNGAGKMPMGTRGTLYGYGADILGPQKSLDVEVAQHGYNKQSTEVVYLHGINGDTEIGDSGAPLLIDGVVVGILSGPGYSDTEEHFLRVHAVASAISTIRELQHAREMRSIKEVDSSFPWIKGVTVQNGELTVIADANFAFYSGRNVRFWINGKYSGEIEKYTCYYCNAWWAKNSTATIKLVQQVHLGDLVQIGIASAGKNTPETAELLYETTVNGIEDVTIKDGRYDIRLSSELMNSGQRLIFWLDGAYAAEVFNGSTYYASIDHVPGGVIIHKGPATAKSILQIAVVPGSPGMDIASPATATKMLYSNAPMD